MLELCASLSGVGLLVSLSGVGKGLRGVELWGSLCGVLMDGCTSLSACGKVGIGR